ncbi:MAG: PmeII family type II restriction endonuclease [Dehalococcoidia bacterium]|nr:PmeII family type II restriction endonuclease [Dehalococcoidia bacterium]
MDAAELEALIEHCLEDFYTRRLQRLQRLRLRHIIARKNPYLFKALGTEKAADIVEQVLVAYVGASDETMFGDAFFEPIARIAAGGKTSDGAGVDFVVETMDRILAVAVKSGPNIFNASQKKRQSQEFSEVRNRLYKLHKQFDALLGHGYGRAKTEPTTERVYRDRSGQAFWAEMTGDPDFYLKLIRLMKDAPKLHKEKYQPEWDMLANRFTREFMEDFCFPDGRIDWEELVRFVSEERSPGKKKKRQEQ